MFNRPSFLAFIFQGIILFIFFILFYQNYNTLNNKEIMNYLLLLSISVGIHSILHYREEKDFNYNPFIYLGWK